MPVKPGSASSRPRRSRLSPTLQAGSARAAASCSTAGHERQRQIDAGGLPDFLPETQQIREAELAGRPDARRPAGPPRRDHRPRRPQDGDQRPQLGRRRSSWPTSRTPTRPPGRTCVEGQINLIDAVERTISFDTRTGKQYRLNDETATLLVRPRGWHLPEKHVTGRRRARLGRPLRLRPLLLPQRRSGCSSAGAGPTSTCPSSRATSRRGSGTTSSSLAQDTLGMPHGTIRATVLIETILAAFEMDGDPLRAARPLGRAQRRPLGLHLQRHQEVPRPARVRAARPRPGHDDRAVHARVHGAARQDVPPPRRPRDGRHGGVHPQPARSRGQRGRAARGSRDDKEREARRRLRRHLGRAPRPGAGRRRSSTRCSASGRTRSTASATTSTSAPPSCSTCACHAGRRDGGRASASTSASASSTSTPGCRGTGAAPSTT